MALASLPSYGHVEIVRDAGYFPVAIVLPTGRILVVFRGGAGHLGITGRLEAAWSDDNGKSWCQPVLVARSERDDRNPAVGVAPNGEIVVAYHHQGSYDAQGKWTGAGPVDTRLTRSADAGQTWSRPYPLSYQPFNGYSPYGRMLTLPNGTMLMPIYAYDGKDPGKDKSYLLRSLDGGLTWNAPTLVADGFNETSLALLPNGEMLAALRCERGPADVWLARSTDLGYTWTTPQRITQPSEHPADLCPLANGFLLMVYGRRHQPFGVEGLLSQDGGATWPVKIAVADAPISDCGYPSALRLANGTVIITYYAAAPQSEANLGKGCLAAAVLVPEEQLIRLF